MLQACLVLLCLAAAAHGSTAITIAEATDPRGIRQAVLSPDGKQVAALGETGEGAAVFLMDADTQETRLIKASSWVKGAKAVYGQKWTYEAHPVSVSWVTRDLLAINFTMSSVNELSAVLTVDLQGNPVAQVGGTVLGKLTPADPTSTQLLVWGGKKSPLLQLDARTGDSKPFALPAEGSLLHWAFDRHGALRAVTLLNSAFLRDATTVTQWYKPAGKAEWQEVGKFKITDNYWVPLSVPDEDDTLIVASSQGRDTRAIFRFDTTSKTLGEMLAGDDSADILLASDLRETTFDHVVSGGLKPRQYWFNPAMDKLQRTVDASLPGRINQLSGDPNNRLLIHSYADVDPGTWYLLDTAKMSLREILQARPQIDPQAMRTMQTLTYPARDGLQIPAYLTRPDDTTGAKPTVVLIFSGPVDRDEWDWNPEVQLLAGHGYQVFQPQFRGSDGFGRRFEEAGYGQWGMAMQDDISDGVNYLIKQGLADPTRICIYGAGYGGYAASWGLIKTPELYRCGISLAGVSDVRALFKDGSDRQYNKIARQLMRHQVGNRDTDKAQMDAVSPVLNADKLKTPILLVHGYQDQRVPINHALNLMRALNENHKSCEWQFFFSEGHGLSKPSNQQRFHTTVLNFLDRHIGEPEVAAQARLDYQKTLPKVPNKNTCGDDQPLRWQKGDKVEAAAVP